MPSQAREYVESLHQNHKDILIYGKKMTYYKVKLSKSQVFSFDFFSKLYNTQTSI